MLTAKTIISQINRHHQLAIKQAKDAVENAKAAGQLLLQVKASIPHGQWTDWLKANVEVSDRQAQRYMAVAQGKAVPLRELADKTDTVSDLKGSNRSTGVWKNKKWQPEAGCMYLFREGEAAYWIHPSTALGLWFHVSKLFTGERMSTNGFKRNWTVFSKVTDPDLTSEFYVGTTHPLGYIGVAAVLESYGLQDLEKSLILGIKTDQSFERPFGEPPRENWYWGENGEWDDREAYIESLIKPHEA